MGIKLYNKLPECLKIISSKSLFKRKLMSYLLEHCFYSTEEYLTVPILQSPVLHQIHNSLYPCLLMSPFSFPPICNPLQTSHWQSIFSHPLHMSKPLQLFISHKLHNVSFKKIIFCRMVLFLIQSNLEHRADLL